MTHVTLPTAARMPIAIAAPPATGVRAGLWLYFLLAYGFTWLCWGLVALSTRQVFSQPISEDLLMLVGGLGPIVAAIGIVTLESGTSGVRGITRPAAALAGEPYVVRRRAFWLGRAGRRSDPAQCPGWRRRSASSSAVELGLLADRVPYDSTPARWR